MMMTLLSLVLADISVSYFWVSSSHSDGVEPRTSVKTNELAKQYVGTLTRKPSGMFDCSFQCIQTRDMCSQRR